MTDREKILYRLSESKANVDIKRYMYNMRRFAAGDDTALGGDRFSLTNNIGVAGKVIKQNKEFPHFKITEHEEGVSNHVFTWVSNIIKQTTIERPRLECPELKPRVSSVREGYILDRFKQGNWGFHQYRLLYSFLVDGMAFAKICMKGGMPRIRYADTIDMFWDLKADSPFEFRYVAQELRISEDTARKEFGNAKVDWMLNIRDTGDSSTERQRQTKERVVRIIEYWDDEVRAFARPGNFEEKSLLRVEKNPYPFIPYEVLSQPILPSMLSPLPHIITVIGAQTGLTALQRSMVEMWKSLKPFYTIDSSCFTPESVAEWEDTSDITVLRWGEDVPSDRKRDAITLKSVDKIPAEVIQAKQEMEQEIVRGLGVNPYVGGAPLDPKFSREVSEISGQSQLGVSWVQGASEEFMGRAVRKFIRLGALHDDAPYSHRVKGTVLEFGAQRPIEPLLRDDVECVVTSGQYETEALRMMKAEKMVAQAMQPPILMRFPRVLEYAIEYWLEVYAARDIEGLMQPGDEDMQKLALVSQIPLPMLQQGLQMFMQIMKQQGQGGAGSPMDEKDIVTAKFTDLPPDIQTQWLERHGYDVNQLALHAKMLSSAPALQPPGENSGQAKPKPKGKEAA